MFINHNLLSDLRVLLTLHMPASPDDIVQAYFVLPTQANALKVIPLGGCEFLTERISEITHMIKLYRKKERDFLQLIGGPKCRANNTQNTCSLQ